MGVVVMMVKNGTPRGTVVTVILLPPNFYANFGVFRLKNLVRRFLPLFFTSISIIQLPDVLALKPFALRRDVSQSKWLTRLSHKNTVAKESYR